MVFYGDMEYRGRKDGISSKTQKQYSTLKFEDIDSAEQVGFYLPWENLTEVGIKALEKGRVYTLELSYEKGWERWEVRLKDIHEQRFEDAA